MRQRRGNSDRAAVEQLFREEYGRLVIVLSAQLRDRGAAEECAQDAFVEAVRHWNKLSTYGRPKGVAVARRAAERRKVAQAAKPRAGRSAAGRDYL